MMLHPDPEPHVFESQVQGFDPESVARVFFLHTLNAYKQECTKQQRINPTLSALFFFFFGNVQ